jgi:hypothetical protein
MSRMVRRIRGAVLRVTRRRAVACVLGLVLIAPFAWLQVTDVSVPWWVEGSSFVSGATGLALLWTGIAGLGPDWVE